MTIPKSEMKSKSDSRNNFNSPPILTGYTFSPEKAQQARDEERLLAIRLETNHTCNLKCRYCYAGSEAKYQEKLSYGQITEIVSQAKDMGAESIVVIGGGEPTIHPDFKRIVSYISSLDMIPMIFSNTVTMSRDLAKFLYDNNASVMGKLDSLDESLQEYFAGIKGAGKKIHQGLENLMDGGFCESGNKLRLGISFVSCKFNLPEIEDIWRFCRNNRIFPNMEVLTPTGRAKENLPDAGLAREEIKDYKLKLLEIDRQEFGYDWLPFTPLTASGCLQHFYSFYITIKGDVRPCAPVKFDENPEFFEDGVYPHNVFRKNMREIYDDPVFKYVRNIEKYLEGKCKGCEHLDQCIGCRGYAYSVGVNEGKPGLEALRSECKQCFK